MTVGMLIVFSFHDSAGTEAAHNTISPAADLALGVILLIVGLVLRSERGERLKESRRTRKAAKGKVKKESMPERMLGKGSGENRLRRRRGPHLPRRVISGGAPPDRRLDAATVPTALVIVGFCLIMTTLIEVPLVGFVVAPERTAATVVRLSGWLAENGGRVGANVAIVLGAILVARGLLDPPHLARRKNHTVRTMRGGAAGSSVELAESAVGQLQRRGDAPVEETR